MSTHLKVLTPPLLSVEGEAGRKELFRGRRRLHPFYEHGRDSQVPPQDQRAQRQPHHWTPVGVPLFCNELKHGSRVIISPSCISVSARARFLPFRPGDRFGASIAVLGDCNNDGNPEIAVGSPLANASGRQVGQVYILELLPCTHVACSLVAW